MTTRYLPEIIYGLAIISLSTHTLWQRDTVQEDRRHYSARITLLEDVARRLRAGETVPQSDFDTIKKLASERGSDNVAGRGATADGKIGWREVILGRKVPAQSDTQEKNTE